MRISDWSSDVCSSDLFVHSSPRQGALINALHRLGNVKSNDSAQDLQVHRGHSSKSAPLRSATTIQESPKQQCAHTCYQRSEEHTSELQSLMRISYAVFCLKKKKTHNSTLKHTNNP